ncbi:MAG: integrase catalytic domain-containing protein [Mangrovicoccus sp.]
MSNNYKKLRLTPCDALVSGGRIYAVVEVTDFFIRIQPLDDADGSQLSISHEELHELVAAEKFSIVYGYFSDRQAARRAMGGRSLVSRLPEKTRSDVFLKELWATSFLELEAEGNINRSSNRWPEFLPILEEGVEQKLRAGLKKPAPGASFDSTAVHRTPGRTSAMGWVRAYEKSSDPAIFIKKSTFNGSNATALDAECEAIVQRELGNYQHPNQILPPQVHHDVNSEIRRRNGTFADANKAPLKEVSLSTIERRIRGLDAFETLVARQGVAVAKNKLGAHGGGVTVTAPLQRVEIDEWEIDLIAILKSSGADFSGPAFRELETGRYWICVAMDAATRSVLGMKLSLRPCVEDATAVLWMAMRDKSRLASELECETEWFQHGHIYHVVVDNGPAFVASEFKAVLSDLGMDYSVLPAGVPKLRARVERIFRSLVTLLMPRLTGRTFSNPQARGDYPSQKYAVHTAESIIELLMRFIVDVYHNRSHKGLEGASPNNAWKRLTSEFGWAPPRDQHELRHILGIPFSRKTGQHGVLINGVNYHSKRLAKHFQKYGQQDVDVRVDSESMAHISVWLDTGADSGWSTLTAGVSGMEDVSFAAWERTMLELRKGNRRAAALSQGMIDRAILRIKEIDAEQCALRQLGPIGDTRAQIERAQKQTFWGLSLGGDPRKETTHVDDKNQGGILSNEILPDHDTDPREIKSLDADANRPSELWSFYDDDSEDEDGAPNQKGSDEQ